MRALRYAFDEALASLWRSRRAALLSALTIAVALFVLGGFLMVRTNLERLAEEWSRAAGLSVYLADDATDADRAGIELALRPGGVVDGYQYVSESDALARFKEMFTDLASAADSFEANPLPASYEVRLQATEGAGEAAETLASQLRRLPGVSDVRYDREWLERVMSAVSVVGGIGFVLGALLTVAAALTVANVVRLTLYARRDEIEIMRLVGAPRAFVDGPFVMEGILQGGLGALLALGAMAVLFVTLEGPYLTPLARSVNLSSVRFLSFNLCLMLLLGGMAVGCLGGLIAATVSES
jgi:cell division transport system permease protein